MAREKIPHAYLFTGIPGVGKMNMAMAMSAALNCDSPVDGDSCGRCPPCRQMMSGNSPDFVKISLLPDKKNIGIDQIRELNRKLAFAPYGRYRVCVVYQAEIMTEEAANSFLKTLEEPPSGNILILNVREPRDLLPTIVSRCQRVAFQPLTVRDIAEWLVREKDLTEDMAIVLARLSEGSLGRALKMSETDFFEMRQEWLLRLMKLPGLSEEKGFDMALKCGEDANKIGIKRSENGETRIMEILSIWESWYRDLLIMKVGDLTNLLINADFSHKLKKIAGNYKINNLIDSLLVIDQAQRDLRRNRNVRLVVEHAVLSLNRLV